MPTRLPLGITATAFASVVKEFQAAVGADWVFTSDDDMETYRDSYSIRWGAEDEYFASAAVAPASTEEVQAVVRIANKYKIPLYPISTGKNLTYGGAAPTYTGSVVVDLKRMNRVLEVDEKRAFALLEPGVSYFDFYQHIQRLGLKVWIDCPDPGWGSPIGNALDHGIGYTTTPFRDHWGAHCGIEVVLANGEVMRTGMGAAPNAKTWQEYRYGVGPDVDGLFAQGNFGIVTKMGFWLMPQPESWLTGTVSVPRYGDFAELVGHCNYLEDSHIANGQSTYGTGLGGGDPQIRAGLDALMADGWPSDDRIEAFVEQMGRPAWTLRLQFFGPEKSVRAGWAYAKERISRTIPGAIYSGVEQASMPLTPAQQKTHHLVQFGIPTMANYAMMARTANDGPDFKRDGHSDFISVVPRSGEGVQAFAKTVHNAMKEVGMPGGTPFRSPIAWWPRTFLMGVGAIWTDHNDPAKNLEGRATYEALVKKMGAAGFPNYRTNPNSHALLVDAFSFNNHSLLRFQESLKDAADPNGILAPGRYGVWPKHLRSNRA